MVFATRPGFLALDQENLAPDQEIHGQIQETTSKHKEIHRISKSKLQQFKQIYGKTLEVA